MGRWGDGAMENEKPQSCALRLFVLYGPLLLLHLRRIEMHSPDARVGLGLAFQIGIHFRIHVSL
jgi:hypothetical protein